MINAIAAVLIAISAVLSGGATSAELKDLDSAVMQLHASIQQVQAAQSSKSSSVQTANSVAPTVQSVDQDKKFLECMKKANKMHNKTDRAEYIDTHCLAQ